MIYTVHTHIKPILERKWTELTHQTVARKTLRGARAAALEKLAEHSPYGRVYTRIVRRYENGKTIRSMSLESITPIVMR